MSQPVSFAAQPLFTCRGMPSQIDVKRTGLARALSKLGFCSRSKAWDFIKSGRVKVNGIVRTDPEWRVALGVDRIEFDRQQIQEVAPVYIMLNKPRGLVTTTSDEKGRPTVFQCFEGGDLPRIMPIGRLDKASEGLLLFSNDTQWAAHISSPESNIAKVYHVQIDRHAGAELLERMRDGVLSEGERLRVKNVSVIRAGEKNCWLEIVLGEGKNRHIRRMLNALDVNVMRLIRVGIGSLKLGDLPKGKFRRLIPAEVSALRDLSKLPESH
jgi:23S rRNA pseudouridine2605 synthase